MTPTPQVALAATVHDPEGRLAAPTLALADRLRRIFPLLAFNVSDATRPEVVDALVPLGGRIMNHAAGEAIIGRARRDAVALAGAEAPVLYTDFDHLLRWIEGDPDDLQRVLTFRPELDFLVVGRGPRAFAAEPRRLRESETLVNHTHALLTGDHWDLMFAIRRMSPRATSLILAESRLDTLANDVEWPLIARRAGLTLGYVQSDALFYRTIEEFGAEQDGGDADPLQWIRRLEFAAQHAAAMRPFLPPR